MSLKILRYLICVFIRPKLVYNCKYKNCIKVVYTTLTHKDLFGYMGQKMTPRD